MSEQAPPPTEDTPAVAGPEGTPEQAPAEETDWQAQAREWQDRYTHLQPEYTRTTQEAATLRERDQWYELLVTSDDPDTRRQAAEALGYQLDEEPPSDNPIEPLERRLGQVEESLTAAQQREADVERAAYVRQVFDERLDNLGIDKEDQDWVLAYAINALPVTEDGWPDIDQAYQAFQQREDARQKRWAQSKRAPHISPNGQSATEVPNLDNRQERQDWMVRRLQENEQAGY